MTTVKDLTSTWQDLGATACIVQCKTFGIAYIQYSVAQPTAGVVTAAHPVGPGDPVLFPEPSSGTIWACTNKPDGMALIVTAV